MLTLNRGTISYIERMPNKNGKLIFYENVTDIIPVYYVRNPVPRMHIERTRNGYKIINTYTDYVVNSFLEVVKDIRKLENGCTLKEVFNERKLK